MLVLIKIRFFICRHENSTRVFQNSLAQFITLACKSGQSDSQHTCWKSTVILHKVHNFCDIFRFKKLTTLSTCADQQTVLDIRDNIKQNPAIQAALNMQERLPYHAISTLVKTNLRFLSNRTRVQTEKRRFTFARKAPFFDSLLWIT